MRMHCTLLTLLALFASIGAFAQVPATREMTRESFMVVVRESMGANRPEGAYVYRGKIRAKLADGREIEMEMAHWDYIGDTHIRFVFDGPRSMTNATPQDLARLGINGVEEALSLALANIKRVYGEPSAKPSEGGLFQVQGKSPDVDSSYFLDQSYWQKLLKSYPEGLVVAVPKRGGLLYAPLSDTNAVERLKRGVRYLYTSSENLRVSSALFLFKDMKWSVFQAPIKQ